MVGLVVGLLVRHIEKAGDLLDPYFAEPLIWRLEFFRVAHEFGGLAASSEGLTAPERRTWFLSQAAVFVALSADQDRGGELRDLGERLVCKARRYLDPTSSDQPPDTYGGLEKAIDLASVRAWASSLNPENLDVHEGSDGLYVSTAPPDEVAQSLNEAREGRERGQEANRLFLRYHVEPTKRDTEAPGPDELEKDLATVRELLRSPPASSVQRPWDIAAMVAGAALEAHLLRGSDFSHRSLAFAVAVLLQVGAQARSRRPVEFEGEFYEPAADRSAARSLPLLLVPDAAPLRTALDERDTGATFKRVVNALFNLARAVPNETRLHLARGLDRVWHAPCVATGCCHHRVAWNVTTETMRGCIPDKWHAHFGLRSLLTLRKPIEKVLARADDTSVDVSRLDAAIRTLAPAAISKSCVSARAESLLRSALDAQRRRLLSHPHPDLDARGSHTLVSARSLLTLAEHRDDSAIHMHIGAYANSSALLSKLLRALSAAAQETEGRAATARRVWPDIVRHVLQLNESSSAPFVGRFYGDMALAALLPRAAGDVEYLYRELRGEPITWWDPLSLRPEVEAWLDVAEGRRECIGQLIHFLSVLTRKEQVRTGLAWVRRLVLADPEIAALAYALADWLISIREEADAEGRMADWRESVDALVVAGVSHLASYSE